MLTVTQEPTNLKNEFDLINRSLEEEYKHQMCAMELHRKKEKFLDLLTNDEHLTEEERQRIFQWVQHNINMVIMQYKIIHKTAFAIRSQNDQTQTMVKSCMFQHWTNSKSYNVFSSRGDFFSSFFMLLHFKFPTFISSVHNKSLCSTLSEQLQVS